MRNGRTTDEGKDGRTEAEKASRIYIREVFPRTLFARKEVAKKAERVFFGLHRAL